MNETTIPYQPWHRAIALLAVMTATLPWLAGVRADPDLYWTVWAGNFILDHAAIPRTDFLSFTAGGRTWDFHSWLSAVIFAAVYRIGGDTGLAALRAALLLATSAALMRLFLARCGHLLVAMLCLLAALPFLSLFTNVRAHSFSWLLVALVLLAFEELRTGRWKRAWLLPVIMLAWVNLYGGFLFGAGLITLGIALAMFEVKGTAEPELRRRRATLAAVLLVVWAATLVNPLGSDVYSLVFRVMRAPMLRISEWRPPQKEQVVFFIVFVGLGAAAAIRAGRDNRWIDLSMFILTAWQTWRHGRFFPLLVIFSLLITANAMGVVWRRRGAEGVLGRFARASTAAVACAAILAPSVVAFARHVRRAGFCVTVPPEDFPIQAVRFLQRNDFGPNLALRQHWGGYAIWHLYPRYRVSMDGRHITVYPEDFVERYLSAYDDGNLPQLMAAFPVDVWLVGREGPTPAALRRDTTWQEVYRDPYAAIFVPAAVARTRGLTTPVLGPSEAASTPLCFP